MDYQIFQLINSLAGTSDFLDYCFIFFAQILILFSGLGVASIAFLNAATWGKELFFDAAIGASVALFVNWIIPLVFFRPRPFVDHDVTQLVFIDPSSKSFPSDHTAITFALAMAVFQYSRHWGIAFFIVAFFIALGRVAVGIHYPLDIAGGIALGMIAAILTKYYLDTLLRRSTRGLK